VAARWLAVTEGTFMERSENKAISEPDALKRVTLTEQIYEELRRRLLIGELEPGARITARSIGRSMGVSLTPARDAIARLVREGGLQKSDTHMYSVPLLDRPRYLEVTRIRVLLEGAAAETAALKVSGKAIDHLEALNEAMRERLSAKAFGDAMRIDAEFHGALYDAAEELDLRRLIDGLWLLVGPTRTKLPLEYRRSLTGFGLHKSILAALRMHDSAAVGAALRADLESGRDAILTVLA
jgi:DNA-binding GntR family transcriptional regulator